MEELDYYDEEGNYLGVATRDVVHRDGLWHKTVQNWLYTKDGKVLFQIRKDNGKFYTTASGHVDKGESIEEAFAREIKEEIGLDCDAKDAKMIELVTWRMDKVKKDGTIMKDRAKSSFFIVPYDGDYTDFTFDTNEVLGIVEVDAEDALKLFQNEIAEIDATLIIAENGHNEVSKRKVKLDEFLVLENETAMDKYGNVLKNILEVTKKVNA